MKIYLLIILILINTNFIFSQNQSVYIQEWVEEPFVEDLEKPLIFVEFWATWCLPCIQAMPQIDLLKDEFGDKVMFMYLSDEPAYTVNKFMQQKNKSFISAVDTQARTLSEIKVETLPDAMVLNANGNIVWRGSSLDLTRDKLHKLVNKYGKNTGNYNRLIIDQNTEIEEEVFESTKVKKNNIAFRVSESQSTYVEKSADSFYFNGNLVELVAYIEEIPQSNVQNKSQNKNYYSIQIDKYGDDKRLNSTLKQFISRNTDVKISKKKVEVEGYELIPGSKNSYYDQNTFDFSENNAKYLASDTDVEIDNATILEMVTLLNQFSNEYFSTPDRSIEIYDWNIHFGYIELTLEQFKNDLGFTVTPKNLAKEMYIIKNN